MYSLIRKLLFLLEAEDAHELTVRQMIALQNIPIGCAPNADCRANSAHATSPFSR